jgi:membrane associated rhomboid family serine protease
MRIPARRPLLALALVAAGAWLAAAPGLAAPLRYERALLAGEPWRFLTGHLVHDSIRLALVDLAVLGALGAWWELRSRAAFAWILLASAVLASSAVLAFTSFASYVGSSGLSSGLFVAAALELSLEARGGRRFLWGLALVLFAAKCALEALAPSAALFVALPSWTSVAVSAHVAGGIGGALVVLARRESRRLDRLGSPH